MKNIMGAIKVYTGGGGIIPDLSVDNKQGLSRENGK